MKLHFIITQGFHFGHLSSKTSFLSNKNLKITKPPVIKKLFFKKLLPSHWFDGVWDDLNFKM